MKRIRAVNNNGVERWEEIYRGPNAETWTIWNDLRLIREFAARMPRSGNVLDLGSGNGLGPRTIAEYRPDVKWTAADHSQAALDVMLRSGLSWEGLHLVDLERLPLPFPDRSFDAVMCTEVLEHLEDPRAAIEEFKRIAPRVFVSVPNENATDTDFHVWSIGKQDLHHWLPGCEVKPARADAILVAFWSE